MIFERTIFDPTFNLMASRNRRLAAAARAAVAQGIPFGLAQGQALFAQGHRNFPIPFPGLSMGSVVGSHC
jgi:hypothetical protein